jgi:hypothetical protein
MPGLCRTVPLCQRYSLDLRVRRIHKPRTLRRKPKKIPRDLDIPLGVVQRILKMWADLGSLKPPTISLRHFMPKLKYELPNVRAKLLGI